ncbi:MAG: hypothetical protein JW908_15460 [Anaerolineales bacterium]|nr:hypothetical protein [Anaerolineales bacterium]
MRTPAGNECPHFFGDYFRGRNLEECRLLRQAIPPITWKPSLCATCPVPGILLANACPNMVLKPELHRPFPFLKQQVRVTAFCTKTNQLVPEPHIGCGECHMLPPAFTGDILDYDPSAGPG